MAKRKSASSSGGGESNQGLIVTMVFFILATIGLGVGTYMGYAGQQGPLEEAKKAREEAKKMEASRDWYRFETMVLKSYMGQMADPKDVGELETLWPKYESGTLGSAEKDRIEVSNIIKTMSDDPAKFTWDDKGGGKKELSKNLKAYVDSLRDELKAQKDLVAQTDKAKKDKEAELKAKEEELAKLKTTHKENYDALVKSFAEEQVKRAAAKEALEKNYATQSTEKASLAAAKAAVETSKAESEAKAQAEMAATQAVVARQRAALERNSPTETAAIVNRGWKIMQLDRTGDTAYINLGSADKVKPQLTFSIHGLDAAGKPMERSKADAEVVSVRGEHLSQVRITYYDKNQADVREGKIEARHDRVKNPVLTNDILANASWSPLSPKHIAIAGSVDLTGDGRDNTEEFIRNLSRQNIIVDGILPLKEPTDETNQDAAKKVTVQTDFLVVGDVPLLVRRDSRKLEQVRKIEAGIKAMEEQAKLSGVRILSVGKYLDLIGYPFPRALTDETPYARTAEPREVKPPDTDAPKKDDTKKDDAKKDAKPPM